MAASSAWQAASSVGLMSFLYATELLLERGANLRPGTVEQHALVRVGEAQALAHFFGRPSFDVAQRDDRLLARRQRRDGRLDAGAGLVRQGGWFRVRLPALRRRRPGARPLGMVGGQEAVWIDRRFRAVQVGVRQYGHRDGASLADTARLGPIDEDPEDPGL